MRGESVTGNIRLIFEAVSMASLVMSGYDRLKRCAQQSLCGAGVHVLMFHLL